MGLYCLSRLVGYSITRIRIDRKPNPIYMTKITLNDRFNYGICLCMVDGFKVNIALGATVALKPVHSQTRLPYLSEKRDTGRV